MRYVLLLWLSILVMVPFAFSSMDSGGLVESLLEIGKLGLGDAGPTREASANMLALLTTRPDMAPRHLPEFLQWCNEHLSMAPTSRSFLPLGIITALSAVFKKGKRMELIDKAGFVLAMLRTQKGDSSITWRKLRIKLVQRVGLVYLKPRSQHWRYQKGTKSLLQLDSASSHKNVSEADDHEEEFDILPEVEDILEMLLDGLRDKDTVVRWSAAKGVGRIGGRLPREPVDDIVEHISSLFDVTESDASWHGGCLALAELSRRGLLLPSRLGSILPVLLTSLQYDVPYGTYSVGAHVRDAACYVAWAFARAYSPSVLAPYAAQLAKGLIVATLFDREINCRRAASAAFQENAGRVGNFPHGIAIINISDYFAVGNRNETYLTLSTKVAQYEEYTQYVIDHLVTVRVPHWDRAIRELAAKALHKLVPISPQYMLKDIIPKLIADTTSPDVSKRHGSVFAVAEILWALAQIGEISGFSESLPDSLRMSALEIPLKIETNRLYRGRGGELVRIAVCRLVECISMSRLTLPAVALQNSPSIALYQKILDENIRHLNPTIQEAAATALAAFCTTYYGLDLSQQVKKELVTQYTTTIINDPNAAARRGCCMALATLPKDVVLPFLDEVLDTLIIGTSQEPKEFKDAETRQQAVFALTKVCKRMGNSGLTPEQVDRVFISMEKSLNDYTTDHRGDVGCWVREAAIDGVYELARVWSGCSLEYSGLATTNFLTPEMSHRMVRMLILQALEKIDRVRAHAHGVLHKILREEPLINPQPPCYDLLCQLIPSSATTDTFATLTRCLSLVPYRYHTLLGIIGCVGGITKSIVEESAHHLILYVEQISLPQLEALGNTFVEVFTTNVTEDRVIIPAFKTLVLLLETKHLYPLQLPSSESGFVVEILRACRTHTRLTREMSKIFSAISVIAGIYRGWPAAQRECLQQLLSLLTHRYPRVRREAVNALSTLLASHDAAPSILRVMEDTQWEDVDMEMIKSAAHKLYELLGIPIPPPPKKTTKQAPQQPPEQRQHSTTDIQALPAVQIPVEPPVSNSKPFDNSDGMTAPTA